ncbi:MAG: SIMPL domain-containing protein [Acidimicrobiia bacterium]|nr:SIMPL domain-containing protein [Acidimicrobiia bacterium]
MTERQILVRGSGRAETAPDFAAITLTINAFDRSREDALADAAHRCGVLDDLLDGLGDALSNRMTASLRVAPRFTGKYDKRVHVGYDVRRSVLCEVRDFSVLGGLLRDAAAQALADADGPYWRIDDDNPVHDEVRRKATADARRRADAYAEGLSVRLGPVAWIAEPGLRRDGHGGSGGVPRAVSVDMPAPSAQGAVEQTVDVVVDRVATHSTVEVAFFIAEV